MLLNSRKSLNRCNPGIYLHRNHCIRFPHFLRDSDCDDVISHKMFEIAHDVMSVKP